MIYNLIHCHTCLVLPDVSLTLVFLYLLQKVHTRDQALEALKPYSNDTDAVSTVWKLSEATRVLEATIKFACEDEQVRLHFSKSQI